MSNKHRELVSAIVKKHVWENHSLNNANICDPDDVRTAIEQALQQVERDILEKAPKICARHIVELRMKAQIAVLDPPNCVYCFVESKTWYDAACVVLNQQGVSHWTDDDTVALLKQKSKEALEDSRNE